MAEHRAIFRKGAAEKGIDQDKADEVFDLMEKFAGYGFNKSHAAAYSCWLTSHRLAQGPLHGGFFFFCANMTVGNGRHRQAQGAPMKMPSKLG